VAERFYTPDSLTEGEYVLTGPEAHHLSTVRRFAPGDRVTLFNGNGLEYPAELISLGKKSAVLNLSTPIAMNREVPFPLVVASAIPKADRGDFLIEKLTELGVTRFVPLITTRSVVIPKENAREKYERTVIEASKQCGRNRLMAVDPPQKWDVLVSRTDIPSSRIVLHTGPALPALVPASGAVVAIGPEGGFTEQEVEAAQHAGWTIASLGPRVLRVETAAIAAVVRLSNPVGSAPRVLP
jgi:16S rRNA (uracil1498-N3)-methyltransferase